MYYCNRCNNTIEELESKQTTYEEFYGVDFLFPNSHIMYYEVCPYCGADIDDIEEMQKCDICGEYCREKHLIDTECLINGGVGFVCPDCFENLK